MGKPDVGRAGAERLININKVLLISGGYCSSVTFSACAVAQQYKDPFLVNTGSVDKMTQPEAFNLKPNDRDKSYIIDFANLETVFGPVRFISYNSKIH